jgi:hypothetical protein
VPYSQLQAEMAALRAQMSAALEAAAADRATLRASMEGDFATAQAAYAKQAEEQLEAEKEKRVAHLQQSAARRIANAGIASGFSAWQEQWEEVNRKRRMLAAAGARLARPALAAAVAGWVGDWRAAELEKVEAGRRQLLSGTAQREAELQAEVNALVGELAAARVTMAAERAKLQTDMAADLATSGAAHAEQMAEHLEAEKEKRVAHLQKQAMRRIANAGIASGFTTWQEQWEEQARQKRMLAAAGARLARPALAAAVALWVGEWRVAEAARRAAGFKKAKADFAQSQLAGREALQAEVANLRAELAAALTGGSSERAALEAKHAADIATAEAAFAKQVEGKLEVEKEKRIAHLQQSAARRIANAGIASGFSTWQGQWAEAARQKRMLAAAGARLARPALAAAVALWVGEWSFEEREKRREAAEAATQALMGTGEAEQLALRAQIDNLASELRQAREVAAEDRAALHAQMTGDFEAAAAAHRRHLVEQAEAQREKRVAHLQQSAARRIANAGIASGFSAWQEQWEEAARQKRMLAAAGARLARPALAAAVALWMGDWRAAEQARQAAEAAASKRLLMDAAGLEREALQEENEKLRAALEAVRAGAAQEAAALRTQVAAEMAAADGQYRQSLAEAAEAEHEKRVGHLQSMAARRLGNRSLARGFGGWHEQWAHRARQRQLLARAGARLQRPALVACMFEWRTAWAAEEAARRRHMEEEAKAELAAHAGSERETLQAELESNRAETLVLLEAYRAEVEELKAQLVGDAAAAEAAYQKQLAQQSEAGREARVAHLQQQAARRIANAGIASGFSAWQEQWEEVNRKRRMLAAAGARLARPALAAALALWVGEWRAEENERAAAQAAAQKKLLQDSASSERDALQAEADALRAQLKAALEGAAAEKAKLVGDSAQNFATAEATYAKQLAQQAEAQREKRVAHLQQQAARRIANAGIASGFTTWQGQWEEKARQKRMLAAAGARLARPALAAAVAGWVAEWRAVEAERHSANAAASMSKLVDSSAAEKAALRAELAQMHAKLADALESASAEQRDLRAKAVADKADAEELLRRSVAELAEEEKEKRVAHLQQQAARRIANAGIAFGFSAWQARWEEVARDKRMLAAAGARLRRPVLAAALAHWSNDWVYELKVDAKRLADKERRQAIQALSKTAGTEREKLEAQLAEVHQLLKESRAGALEDRAALHAQMTGDFAAAAAAYAKQAEEQLEAEKEKRVAHLQQQAARRIANAGIASGFTTWQEQWEEVNRKRRMLAAAGARLARPALAAAMAGWVADWRAAEAEVAELAKRKLMSSSNQKQSLLIAELEEVKAELASIRESSALNLKSVTGAAAAAEVAYAKEIEEQLEAEKEKRVAHLQQQAARRIANADIASGFTTWQEQWEEKARQKRMLAAAGARLARPALAAAVAHWVDNWRVAEQARQAAEAAASKQALMSEAGSIQRKLQLQLTEVSLARTLIQTLTATATATATPTPTPTPTPTLTLSYTLPGTTTACRCSQREGA